MALTNAHRKLREMRARLVTIQAHKIEVGVFSQAEHPLGGGTIAEVAIKNHFGAPGVPARPFLSIAAATSARFIVAKWREAIKSNQTAAEVFDTVGTAQVVAVQETILDRKVPPPNAASTVRRKQSSTPLIDTGTLLDHIAYRVVAK